MAERLNLMGGLRPAGVPPLALLSLVLVVAMVHGCVVQQLSRNLSEFHADRAMPARIEVAYVRDMALAPPPAVAPMAAPAPVAAAQRGAAPKAAKAASEPQAGTAAAKLEVAETAALPDPLPGSLLEPPPATVPEPLPEPPPPTPAIPSVAAAAASSPPAELLAKPLAAAANAASGPSAPAFDWPGSTRLTYKLSGNYRGEVNGEAQVEWVRAGSRYQVHLDLLVGLRIAPVITRRMSSDGELTAQGLSPRRYDEDTKVAFRERRRLTMLFEPDAVVMPGGERRERWPGVQDTASQFVQLSYLFTVRPELLRVGGTVEVPLALPRNIDRWVYEVTEEVVLSTPFGPVATFHLKPRRVTRPGGELSAEMWFAPELRYLPARIRIQQDADTYIDLLIDRRPQLAAP